MGMWFMCKCDRELQDAKDFLKEKGLLDEFLRYFEEREKKRKRRGRI